MKIVTITGYVTLKIQQVLEVPEEEIEQLMENLECNFDIEDCSWDVEEERDFEALVRDKPTAS